MIGQSYATGPQKGSVYVMDDQQQQFDHSVMEGQTSELQKEKEMLDLINRVQMF